VGDAEFQKKAIGKMQDVSRGEGRTVLFVSHNMGAVKSLCKTGLLLENGIIKDYGDADSIVSKYIRGDSDSPTHKEWKDKIEYSKDGFELLEIGIRRKGGEYGEAMPMDDDMELIIRYRLTKDFEKMWLTMHYKNEFGTTIFSSSAGEQVPKAKTKGEYTQICTIPKNTLNWGNFSITLLAFHDNAESLCRALDVLSFPVSAKTIKMGNWMGGREPGDVTPKFPFSEKQTG
jgi:lipopolysaccharide transport system ATP-binding protein